MNDCQICRRSQYGLMVDVFRGRSILNKNQPLYQIKERNCDEKDEKEPEQLPGEAKITFVFCEQIDGNGASDQEGCESKKQPYYH